MRLHALARRAAALTGDVGLIGRVDAERLATQCGALVEELVEAGLWDEFDLSFQINALAV